MPITVLAVLLGVTLVYAIWTYNRFMALQQRAKNAFSDVDVQLKRRWDLVPPLVEVVRGYAGHEHEVLTEVVAARGLAMSAGDQARDPAERGSREAGLAQALQGIFVFIEDYPALKADSNFLALHNSLVETENQIQYARRYHNAVVRDLNTLRQSIPSALVGSIAGVRLHDFFQLNSLERAVPEVDLGPDSDSAPEVPS